MAFVPIPPILVRWINESTLRFCVDTKRRMIIPVHKDKSHKDTAKEYLQDTEQDETNLEYVAGGHVKVEDGLTGAVLIGQTSIERSLNGHARKETLEEAAAEMRTYFSSETRSPEAYVVTDHSEEVIEHGPQLSFWQQ